MPLTSYFFDLLHVDGEDLVDSPGRDRFARLAAVLPPELVVPRTVTADPGEAARLFDEVVAPATRASSSRASTRRTTRAAAAPPG